jgi:hypothetical protein
MKASEAIQILQSIHPDSEVTLRLGKTLPLPKPYQAPPTVVPPNPYISPYAVPYTAPTTWPNHFPYVTCNTVQ